MGITDAKHFCIDMDLVTKIAECKTVAELTSLENMCVLSHYEQGLLFERKVELIYRSLEWGVENEQLGLTASPTDSWTPEQRETFIRGWQNDDPLLQNERVGLAANFTDSWTHEQRQTFMRDWQNDEPLVQKRQKRSYEEMNDGAGDRQKPSQIGRGEKRSFDEMNDEPADDEVSDSNYFTVKGVKQIRVIKFRTTGAGCTKVG